MQAHLPGLGGNSGQSRQKGTHLKISMMTGNLNQGWENIDFHEYRKHKVDLLAVITFY